MPMVALAFLMKKSSVLSLVLCPNLGARLLKQLDIVSTLPRWKILRIT